MTHDYVSYSDFLHSLHRYQGPSVHEEILLPWVEQNGAEIYWLDKFANRPARPIPKASDYDLYRLYGLSRIVQLLEYAFQPESEKEVYWKCPLSLESYLDFAVRIGLRPVFDLPFHPFYHETVVVSGLSSDGGVHIQQELWPPTFLGKMLFHRGGCVVTGAKGLVEPGIADRTTVYWADTRKYCPRADLGDGWGHNSQWLTRFRRDYLLDGVYHYNADGKKPITPETPDTTDDTLTFEQRMELLRHRRFVTAIPENEGHYPYEYTATELSRTD